MAAPRGQGKPIDFGTYGTCGVTPFGVRWLLDTAELNREGLWQRSAELWAHGVMCPRSSNTDDGIDKRINELSQHYPANGTTKYLGVAVHERKLRRTGESLRYLFRGDHVIGDYVNIAELWADFYLKTSSVGWDLRKEAVCWSGQAPGSVFVPYVDLDERAPTGCFSDVWRDRVVPTVAVINAAITKLGVRPDRTPVFMNIREIPEQPGLAKYSFHLHWPGLGIRNIGKWKSFLLSLDELPRAVEWIQEDGKWNAQPKVSGAPIADMAVYGGKMQLFRGPFSGKRGDASSVMYPVVVTAGPGNEYEYKYHNETTGCDRVKIVNHILDARITAYPTDVKILDIPDCAIRPVLPAAPHVASVRSRVCTEPSVAPMDPTIDNIHRFITPFLERFILPEWQAFRQKMLLNTGGVAGAVVPTANLVINHERKAERRGRAFFSVVGDTFCECDPSHIHTANPGKIGLVLDYVRSTIAQTCFVCGPSVRFPVYSFLHTGNQIRMIPRERCGHSRVSCWGKSPSPYQAFLDFYGDRVCMQGETQLVHIYDEDKRVWCSGRPGNAIAGRLIDNLNRVHSEYIDAQRRVFMDIAIARLDGEDEGDDGDESEDGDYDDEDGKKEKPPATRDDAIRSIEKKARAFIAKRCPFVTFPPTSRAKFLVDLSGCNVHVQVLQMNPFANLIPMANGQCIDVFTGAITDMNRHHYFTSVVNAKFNPEDPNIPTLLDWILEISTGDNEKAVYLKRMGAYCMTMLVHDPTVPPG